MKTNIEVTINGKVYPCRPTMGAMLRFKKETGKEVTEITTDNFSDLCTYLYCCVASASAADKVPFDMPLMDFADALSAEDMENWAKAMQAGAAKNGEAEKKRKAPLKASTIYWVSRCPAYAYLMTTFARWILRSLKPSIKRMRSSAILSIRTAGSVCAYWLLLPYSRISLKTKR